MWCAVADEADDVVDGGVVAELEFVVAFDAVFLADGGEQFGLFDGVDAEVCFHVEVHGQHLGGIAGLFGDQGNDARRDRLDGVGGVNRRCRRRDGATAGATAAAGGTVAAGAVVVVGVCGVRSRTKPMTWLMVG